MKKLRGKERIQQIKTQENARKAKRQNSLEKPKEIKSWTKCAFLVAKKFVKYLQIKIILMSIKAAKENGNYLNILIRGT